MDRAPTRSARPGTAGAFSYSTISEFFTTVSQILDGGIGWTVDAAIPAPVVMEQSRSDKAALRRDVERAGLTASVKFLHHLFKMLLYRIL